MNKAKQPPKKTKPRAQDSPAFYRTTLSLPSDLAVGLNQLAKRLGISQSALVASLLSQAIPNLLKLVDTLPQSSPDAESQKRFRGQSIDYVTEAVASALRTLKDV